MQLLTSACLHYGFLATSKPQKLINKTHTVFQYCKLTIPVWFDAVDKRYVFPVYGPTLIVSVVYTISAGVVCLFVAKG